MHEDVNGRITTSILVVGPCCDLTVGKVDEHRKLSLHSLTQWFIYYYNLQVVAGKKKESMKVESFALTGQRETCHEEKERADIDHESYFCIFLLFSCDCSLVLSSQVRIWWVASFRSSPKNRGPILCLSLHLSGRCSTLCLYLITSSG